MQSDQIKEKTFWGDNFYCYDYGSEFYAALFLISVSKYHKWTGHVTEKKMVEMSGIYLPWEYIHCESYLNSLALYMWSCKFFLRQKR